MARLPYAKVFIKKNGRDLTDYVTSFSHEKHIKKDAISEIKLASVKGEFDGDDVDIVAGGILVVTYGFANTPIFVSREVRISNIEWDYRQNGQEIIRLLCTDKSNVIKKGGVSKKWTKKKASEIASEIAEKYSLNSDIKPTKVVYSSYVQGNKSDYEVLHDLARREGAYEFFVSDNVLHFRPADYSKKAVRTFTLGVDIISLDINLKEIHQSRGTSKEGSTFSGIDAATKKQNTMSQGQAEWSQKFGANHSYRGRVATTDSRFTSLGNQSVQGVTNNGKSVESEENKAFLGSGEEGEHISSGYAVSDKHTKKKKVLTARLEIELEPNFAIGEVIAINGIAKRVQGNWYIESVKDSITGRGITHLELTRDASVFKVKDGSDPTEQANNAKMGGINGKGDTDKIFQQFGLGKYLGRMTEEFKNRIEKEVKEKIQK